MAKVTWAPSALADVDAIGEFIARDSVDQASLFVERLLQAADRLVDLPMSGRVIPEKRQEDYRELIIGPYRLMYRVAGDDVTILGVIHGARDWKP